MAIGLASVLAVAEPSLADDYGKRIGSDSGQTFDEVCKGTDLLIGFRFASSDSLNSFTPLCGQYSGSAFTAEYTLRELGNAKGLSETQSSHGTLRCPSGMAIKQLGIYLASTSDLGHVSFTCASPIKGPQPVYQRGTPQEGQDASHANSICGPGKFAVGIVGSGDRLVASLGLRCRLLDELAPGNSTTVDDISSLPPADDETPAPPPDDQTTQPPADGTPAPPSDDQTPTGEPSTRTVRDPTTVYDRPVGKEIAYLNPGDDVSIVACTPTPQDWCQITSPQVGYVWGADLNP